MSRPRFTFIALWAQAAIILHYSLEALGATVNPTVLWVGAGIWTVAFVMTAWFAWVTRND